MNNIQKALSDIKDAEKKCRALAAKDSYTIKEMKELRTLLLKTVRNNIDCYVGLMPDKRYY